ncbi:elongation factor P maturation arginine rhamnosyltransferase EarP [Herbaspirillum sp. LeCh32-8]|uniref:elongation factor P maturation arginine rhamnosyltransferase EarP n=1 Tax=Herbaspirillum sp. LeCh32-8 TaxID=2821356 RepID=UPI001AE88032|nr:elongation factor P maturation arginine rhamnosyltransferase EarP [Herbaspirillum sp. LeCh32-8]MBP0596674.1 elongation factor P maturation arginine rhamnosyltransferase EarP [Herbaspirillum sp. LeCh32-8]
MQHETLAPNPLKTLDLFCRVVDNYGDIGICWRLARQLAHEHGIAVRLWVDDLASFKRIWPEIDAQAALQQAAGVTVRHWSTQDGSYAPTDVADIVMEFFGCEIPPGYVEAMAQRAVKPVWFNLEGLSAEPWVEGCHTLPSPHRTLKLTKYFFFPGFNERTGGLSGEADLEAQRQAFLREGQAAPFLQRLGVTPQEQQGLKVSLFCYDYAPIPELFAAWQTGPTPVTCLVPEGVARSTVEPFLGAPMQAGAAATRGALTVRVLPFVPQTDYDRLLWSCDFNFVRGEDSFVRAQWAGKPFVWNIYQQDKNLHHTKLNAFLKIYAPATPTLIELNRAWNGANHTDVDWTASWQALEQELPALTQGADQWLHKMLANGDFMANLLNFARRLVVEAP